LLKKGRFNLATIEQKDPGLKNPPLPKKYIALKKTKIIPEDPCTFENP